MQGNRSMANDYVPQFELRPATNRTEVVGGQPAAVESTVLKIGCDENDCVICNSKTKKSEAGSDRGGTFLIILLLIELLLGIACLTIEAHYEVNTLFTRYYSYHYLERNMRQHLVSARLLYGTTTAMPVFVAIIILTIYFGGRRTRFSILIILITFVGFVVYTAAGIVSLTFPKHDNWVPNGAKLMFEILAIITGLFYLIHMVFELCKK